jgi:hypothetical protein
MGRWIRQDYSHPNALPWVSVLVWLRRRWGCAFEDWTTVGERCPNSV